MKTIDTSKPWHVHEATENTHPEIVGPGGIVMDVYDATNEQAQEIADILNGAASQYSITDRVGEVERVYSGPAADEVSWMARQDEQKVEGATTLQVDPANLPDGWAGTMTIRRVEPEIHVTVNDGGGLTFDEASTFVMQGRQGGKTASTLEEAYRRMEGLHKELEHYKMLAEERNQLLVGQGASNVRLNEQIEKLQYERSVWEDTAANYSRGMSFYQEQLDRCGRALGHEAYVSDDGSVQKDPLRAKVAEMVEKLCAEKEEGAEWEKWAREYREIIDRALLCLPASYDVLKKGSREESRTALPELVKRATFERTGAAARDIAGALFDFAGMLTTGDEVYTFSARHDAAPAVEALRKFADKRDLHLDDADVRDWQTALSKVIKTGPCAKQKVIATIIMPDGRRFIGENACQNPQAACPRDAAGYKTGEGYHLCKEVCQQTGHAEVNAISAAGGENLKGAFMYIEGHTYACEPCRMAMVKAGLNWYKFGPPPGTPEECIKGGAIAPPATECIANSAPEIPDVPTMRDAFVTYESGAGRYFMVFKFKKLDEMHQAGREWNALDRALKERAE